jgi:hypothetical protein
MICVQTMSDSDSVGIYRLCDSDYVKLVLWYNNFWENL